MNGVLKLNACILGGKKIDTKTKQIMNLKATFNERFAMKTILDFNVFEDDYDPKPVSKYNALLTML